MNFLTKNQSSRKCVLSVNLKATYKAGLFSSPHFMETNTEVTHRGECFDKGPLITLRNCILNSLYLPTAMYHVA